MGNMHDLGGYGLPQDDVEALRYFNLGCALGDADACAKVAMFYSVDRGGLTQDYACALALFEKSCAGGVRVRLLRRGRKL